MPEVPECYRLSGEKDYPLKVVADDTPGYDAFVVNRLDRPAVSTDGPAESRS
jgi:DNA-binding Lrp family transcriptional regulator